MTLAYAHRVRLLAAGLVFAFVGQLGYVAKREEPYPALMMPRFAWAGPEQVKTVSVVRPEIIFSYDDGRSVRVTQAELLKPVPDGHHYDIMHNLLAPLDETAAARASAANKHWPPAWLFPGYHLASLNRTTPAHVQSLRAWLRQRAAVFHAGAKATSCRVDWFTETRSVDASFAKGPKPSVELSGRFEIDLP